VEEALGEGGDEAGLDEEADDGFESGNRGNRVTRLECDGEDATPEPPKLPRKPSRRLSPEERAKTKGQPSWKGKPKREWDRPDLSC
jgi:hypothetical protein